MYYLEIYDFEEFKKYPYSSTVLPLVNLNEFEFCQCLQFQSGGMISVSFESTTDDDTSHYFELDSSGNVLVNEIDTD